MTDVEVVETIYTAMAERDFAALFELLDPECVVTQDERLPWGGRHVGHDGFANFGLTLTGTIASLVTTDAVFTADPGERKSGLPLESARSRRSAGCINRSLPFLHEGRL